MATAQVYIKRFYIKVEIRKTNPFLVITTALYLACKMEECPQHIRLMNQEARSLWTGTVALQPKRDETRRDPRASERLLTEARLPQTCNSSTTRPK